MGKKGTASKVKGMAGAWGKAREKTKNDSGDFVPVEPGSFKMQICKITDGKFGGDENKLKMNWCVVEAEDDDDLGKICTDFEGYESEDRAVWMQRLLAACGVEGDDIDDIDGPKVLFETWNTLIEEQAVCNVTVKNDGEYTNMKIKKRVDDPDSDILVDAKEALSGNATSSDSSSSDDDDDDDDNFEKGDAVKFERKGETVEGVIKDFDKDDNALVKIKGKKSLVTVDCDKLDDADEKDPEPEEKEEEEEPAKKDKKEKSDDDDDDDDFDPADLKVDDKVNCEIDNQIFTGVVQAKPNKKKKLVSIKFDEDEETEDTEFKDIKGLIKDDDSDSDDDDKEFEKGDKVVVKVRGKSKEGKVVKVTDDKVTVKLDANGKKVEFDAEKVAFATDED